ACLTGSVEMCLSCSSLTTTTSEDESTFSLIGSGLPVRFVTRRHPITPKVITRITAIIQILWRHLFLCFMSPSPKKKANRSPDPSAYVFCELVSAGFQRLGHRCPKFGQA